MRPTNRHWLILSAAFLYACGPGGAGSSGGDAGTGNGSGGDTNSAPVAALDTAEVYAGVAKSIGVLNNDTDPDGDALSLSTVIQPQNGSALISDNDILYTSAPAFLGTDQFSYTVRDPAGATATATVTVTVTQSPNRAPIAQTDLSATPMGVPVVVSPLSNDTDPDGDPLTLHSVEAAANGSIDIDDGGTPANAGDDLIVYTPNAGYAGPDTILYRISDGIEIATGVIELIVGGNAGDRISGVVMKGAIRNAQIRIHTADAALQAIGAPLAQTVTDSDGAFSVPLPTSGAPLIVVAAGGSFENEANSSSTETVTLSESQILESLLPAGETRSVVTMYANALLLRARHFAASSSADAAILEARSVFSSAYGFDPISQLPYDPQIAPGPDPLSGFYALAIGGAAEALSQIATRYGVAQFDYAMIQGAVRDLSDCRLDGRDLNGPVTIDLAGQVRALPDDLALNTQILRFRNNHFARFSAVPLRTVDAAGCDIADTVPPVIVAPANVVAVTTGATTAVALGAPTVSDNVSVAANIVITNDAPAAGFALGVTTVTWTARDEAGLSSTAAQTVTITPAGPQAPVLVAPVPDANATQGLAFSADLSVYFSDANGDTLVFAASGLPASLSLAADGLLSGTPLNADALAGPYTVTVTANDGASGVVSDVFLLSVANVNDAPVATAAIGDRAATEDVALSLDLAQYFADPDGDALTFAANGLPASLAITSNGTITGTPTDADTAGTPYAVTVTANDPLLASVSSTFALSITNVNVAPTISAIADPPPVAEDGAFAALAFTVGDDDTAAGALVVTAASSNPALVASGGLVLGGSGADRNLTVTPNADANGTAIITVRVNDGTFDTTTMFTVSVTSVNDAPAFGATDLNLVVDFAGTATNTVSPAPVPADETAQVVTYSVSPDPAAITWANVGFDAATGEMSASSVPGGVGSQVFTVTANDAQAVNNNASVDVTLSVSNTAPTFSLSADVAVSEDFPTTQNVAVTPDPVPPGESSQVVTYSLSPASVPWANLSIDPASGLITITAVADASGSQLFTVTADDGASGANTATDTFTLTVTGVNDAPAFVADDLTLLEDFAGAQTSVVTPGPVPADESAQGVTYAISPDPAGVSFANVVFNPATGQISATATANGIGSQLFTVTADDGQAVNGTAADTFTLTVDAVNDPPAFSAGLDLFLDEDFPSTETVTVTPALVPPDEASQNVAYTLVPASVNWANVSIDSGDGTVTITSAADLGGTQVFTIVADDGQAANNIATDTFTLTVNPINDAPTFATSGDLLLDEDFAGTQNLTVTPDPTFFDDAAQVPSYALSPAPATIGWANLSFDSATGRIGVTAVADGFGSQVFTITADDGQATNNTAAQPVTVTVAPVNDAPTFSVSGDVVVDMDFGGAEQVLVTPDPVPANEAAQAVVYALSPPAVGFANVAINPATGAVDITAIPAATGCQVFTITADDGEAANNTASGNFSLMVRSGAANEDLNGDGVPDSIQLQVGAKPCAAATTVVNVTPGDRNSTILPTVPDGAAANDPTYVLYEPNGGQSISSLNELDLSLLPGSCRHIAFIGSLDNAGNVVLDAGAPTTNFVVSGGRAAFVDACENITLAHVGLAGATGGGLETNDSILVMDNVHVRDNLGGNGGGISIDNSDVTVRNSLVASNFAFGDGGGIYAQGPATVLALENTVISGNATFNGGGGIYLEDTAAGVRVFNSLITANRGTFGGGLYLKNPDGSVVSASTIAYNEANSGAAIFYETGSSGPTIADNILYFNRTQAGAISTYNGAVTAAHSSYNLIEQSPVGVGDIDVTGVGPRWQQGFYLNQATSPAVDSGSSAAAVLGLDTTFTDATGGTADAGTVDRGYHFAAAAVIADDYQENNGTVNQITVANGANDVSVLIEPLAGGSRIGRGHLVVATLEGANAGLADLDAWSDVDPLGDGRSSILHDLGDGSYLTKIDALGFVGAPTTITLRIYIDGVAMPVVFNVDRTP